MSYEDRIHNMTDYEIIRNSYIRAAHEEQALLPPLRQLTEPEEPVRGKRVTEEQYRRKQLIGAWLWIIGMPLMCVLFGN